MMKLSSSRMKSFLLQVIALIIFLLLPISYLAIGTDVVADATQDRLNKLNDEINEYETEILRLNSEANTLSNQIAQYDAQISLTTLRISQTEEKIDLLGGRINLLETSLSSLSNAFTSRVNQSYKLARLSNESYSFFLSANKLSDAVSSYYYLEKIQEADRSLLLRLEKAQSTYIEEKSDQENLQDDLEDQKSVLGAQKSAKAKLLTITKNDERRYQDLLVRANAEKDAIQAIIAGKGEETEVGKVGEGQRIASIIPTASTCSSGGHLHFEVAISGTHRDPASYLIPKEVIWDNAPDSAFNFAGGWQWPLNDPVRITQGYGMTYYASNLRYYGGGPHTGIDMVGSNDYTVKAVKDGTLYQGVIACGGGVLRYVRVEQSEGIDVYYLHINY